MHSTDPRPASRHPATDHRDPSSLSPTSSPDEAAQMPTTTHDPLSATVTHARTHMHTHNCFRALWILSGTFWVSRYQKKHSPTSYSIHFIWIVIDAPQTPDGHLTTFCITFCHSPLIITLVLFIFYSHASILHVTLLLIKLSTTRSSAYNNSHGKATLNSLDKASMTITNSKGLNAEPWCIPTFTINCSFNGFCTSMQRHKCQY